MSRMEPREKLRQLVQRSGTQAKAAEALGVSRTYICDMLAGRRDLSKAILRKLGYTSIRVQL